MVNALWHITYAFSRFQVIWMHETGNSIACDSAIEPNILQLTLISGNVPNMSQ